MCPVEFASYIAHWRQKKPREYKIKFKHLVERVTYRCKTT